MKNFILILYKSFQGISLNLIITAIWRVFYMLFLTLSTIYAYRLIQKQYDFLCKLLIHKGIGETKTEMRTVFFTTNKYLFKNSPKKLVCLT